MLVEQHLIIMVASLVAIYLTINGTSGDKRLLNALLALVLNAVAALSSFSVEMVKTVDNGTQEVVRTLSYSDSTLAILHVLLGALALVFVVTGAYRSIEDEVK